MEQDIHYPVEQVYLQRMVPNIEATNMMVDCNKMNLNPEKILVRSMNSLIRFTYIVVMAYNMNRWNMDMMKNEMVTVLVKHNQRMSKLSHRMVHLMLEMMDTCRVLMVA